MKRLLVKESPGGTRRPNVFAHTVPQKGVDDQGFAVECIKDDI